MKKITSLFLAVLMSLTFSTAAYAAGPVDRTASVPLRGTEQGRVVLTDAERASFEVAREPAAAQESDTAVSPRLGTASAGISEIIGYPLMYDIDSGELFYYTHIGRKVTFASAGQFSSLRLTASEVKQTYNEAYAYLAEHRPNEEHTYTIVGWYLETLVKLRSDAPRYIEYRIAEPNFGMGTDYARANIPSAIISYRIKGPCGFPSNASPTEYFYIGGIEGTYYYATSENKVLGIPFRAGLALNVTT